MGRKHAGGCKCRSRRGRRKAPYRSEEEARQAIERYELTDSEPYKCPVPGDKWHLRHVKGRA